MRVLTFFAGVLICAVALADVVHLKDGSKLVGTLRRTGDGYAVTDDKGKTTAVHDNDVASVEKVSTVTPQQAAASALAALRRQVDSISDPKIVVDRFEAYLRQHKGTPSAEDAARELPTWQDRVARGMVKVGGKWMTREEHVELFRRTLAQIDQARSLIRDSRYREADTVVEQILSADPTNTAGLYLRSLILLMQDRLGPARPVLDKLRGLLPDHGPTLNNIAVLLYRQKAYPGALTLYSQAMVHSPHSREILNNVAEAIQALPEENKKIEQTQRAARLFNEQDAVLQQKMGQQGLFRWGSQWITQQQWAEIQKAEQEVKAKMDALQADFEKIRSRIVEIETRVDTNRRTIDRLEASRWYHDANGNAVLLPRPEMCYQLERENDLLRQDREMQIRRLATFKEKAAAIQAAAPQPKFTGVQHFIGVEGTPLPTPPGAPPATGPAPPQPPPP